MEVKEIDQLFQQFLEAAIPHADQRKQGPNMRGIIHNYLGVFPELATRYAQMFEYKAEKKEGPGASFRKLGDPAKTNFLPCSICGDKYDMDLRKGRMNRVKSAKVVEQIQEPKQIQEPEPEEQDIQFASEEDVLNRFGSNLGIMKDFMKVNGISQTGVKTVEQAARKIYNFQQSINEGE